MSNIMVVMCPPFSKYPIPPDDQPGCVEEICNHCKNKMWVSAKKRLIISAAPIERLLVACYDCIEKMAKAQVPFLASAIQLKI